jgi:catechol 2,3-dioxygenase-like lactoylglutathione lyase family enzyme
MPEFPALGHVAVTVTDLSTSVPWYTRLIGAEPVLDEDTGPFRHVVWALGGTLFGLHEFPEGAQGAPFDERRVGLDHVSFGVADRDALSSWQAHLEDLGIEHGGIKDANYGSGVSFRDPDNIALEFFCPPGS